VGEFGVELGFQFLEAGDGEGCDFDCEVELAGRATIRHSGIITLTRLCALSLSHVGDAWAGVELPCACDDVNFGREGFGGAGACSCGVR
jgi:hypothetical protein